MRQWDLRGLFGWGVLGGLGEVEVWNWVEVGVVLCLGDWFDGGTDLEAGVEAEVRGVRSTAVGCCCWMGRGG